MNVIDKIKLENGETRNISIPDDLTDEQKTTIRQNIGAVEENGTYNDMTVGNATHAQNDGNGDNIAQSLQGLREDISPAGTTQPLMDGAGAVGTSRAYAREDHVHPSDTAKANVADLPTFFTITLPYTGWQNDTLYSDEIPGLKQDDLIQFVPSNTDVRLVIENNVRAFSITSSGQIVFKRDKSFTLQNIFATIIIIHERA